MHFLFVPGVPGESIEAGHEGWIEVESFSWDSKPSPSFGSGQGTGKKDFEALDLSIPRGAHTGTISMAAASGKHYTNILFDINEGKRFRRYDFSDSYFTSFQDGGSEPTPKPIDQAELHFDELPPSKFIDPPPANAIDPKSPAGVVLSQRQKQAVLHIRVVDENGNERVPKGGDSVTAGQKLNYDKTKGFVRLLEGKGELIVNVQYDGFENVMQSFRYDAPAARPTFAPFWPGTHDDPDAKGRRRDGYLLACMQLNRAAGGHDEKRSPKVFHLTVTLHPTRMYVAVIGCDYWEHADAANAQRRSLDFDKYARTYADHLAALGVTNLSSSMKVLDCQRGRIEHWDRVRVDGSLAIGWGLHRIRSKKEPCPKWPTGKSFDTWRSQLQANPADARRYLGATDIYGYLGGIGRQIPGAVVDFSVFSHAWAGGPILFNTNPAPQGEKDGPTRFAGDLDMRYWKDFLTQNTSFWSDMPKAFASNAVVRVWGCFSTDLFNKMVRYLLGEGGVNGRFVYKDPRQKLDLDLDRNGVVSRLKSVISADSYMSRIGKFVKRDAYGGLPGFGADNEEYNAVPTLDAKLRARIRGQICHVPRITREARFRTLFQSAELGAMRFNEFGYLLYKS